jgi:DNA polymerase III subunit delta
MASSVQSKAAVVPWHGIREASVVLIVGPETFLADRALQILANRMKSADPQVEVSDLDASGYQQGELLQRASPSLFGEPRLVRVSGVEKCSDDFLEDALDYLQEPQADVVVVFRHQGGNRGKKLLDALRASGAQGLVVECKELKKDDERMAFIQNEFQAANVALEPRARRALADAFSSDLAELAAACAQLISDSQGKPVTEETVDRYYGGRVESTTFEIADHAIAGRGNQALVLLRHAVHSGVEPVLLVAAFAMKLRSMAKVGGARGGVDQVASDLGIPSWQVRIARENLRGWDEAGLGHAIVTVADTDALVKGASRDPHYAIEKMVRIVSQRGKGWPTESG